MKAKTLLALLALAASFSLANAQGTKRPVPSLKIDNSPLVSGTAPSVATFAPLVDKVAPSVVTVFTTKNVKRDFRDSPMFQDPMFRRFFGNPSAEPRAEKQQGLGSGVIVSAEGHILTANHVIEGADEIMISLGGEGGKEYRAEKIGGDPGTDIAVLKIQAEGLQPMTLANSDLVKAGDVVLAIGNPFGLRQTVTMGIVSAVGRGGMGIVDYENFIQTDAAINVGNSGGALIDSMGRLVGINSAIFSRSGGNQGIGFAVPSNLARSVMEKIFETGRVTRGYLGIVIQPVSSELAEAFKLKETKGALISEVSAGGPADKAGFKSGDVIIAVNDQAINDPRQLRLLIGGMTPGTQVRLKYIRNGQEATVEAKLGELPSEEGKIAGGSESGEPDILDGITVGDLTPELRSELKVPAGTDGAVITQIDPASPGYEAGLRRGQVIQELNREPVKNAQEAVALSERLKAEKKVLVRVVSDGGSRYVVVQRKK